MTNVVLSNSAALPRAMLEEKRTTARRVPWQRFLQQAALPVPSGSLAVFRMVLGALIVVSVARFFYYDWVTEYFVKPRFFFKYPGFEWIPHPGALGVRALFLGVGALGAAFATGLYFRVVAPLLFLGFAWIQGLDATNYLNHYYLVTWLLLLSCFMPLGEVAGLDAVRKKSTMQTLPQWMLWLLRFQIGCVYVFAAKAKFTTDWLVYGEPLGIWLSSRTQLPILGQLFGLPHVHLAFAWAGFLFDATIVG
ncbi:MAG: HTTM domain-containing protein, partial [Polyangiaceae bacterium]|nr:HTTM domain-containing protein [Polyangiaceae bacterium]